jgi:hypothetical protein
MKGTTLRKQLEAFDKGIYLDSEGNESWCYNFYDWFCKDSTLQKKSDKLFGMVKKFLEVTPQIDQDKYYVFFKNNCPMDGPLYDDFRICAIEDGGVSYNITGKSGHSGLAEMYVSTMGFNEPYLTGRNFTELIEKIKDKPNYLGVSN